jgi:glycosyltransferase involved in cell wall biosynthesis
MNNRGLIIMLCRNGLAYSRQCLKTLQAQTTSVDILVVDNASSDGTARYMAAQQARDPHVYRMSFPQVKSVSWCWNRALEWAWAAGHKEALVCNYDIELLPATYETLVPLLYTCNQGLITAVGSDRPAPPNGILLSPHPDYGCFLIARWAHEKVPFDEHYQGAYFEDNDHHIRLFRAGIGAHSINLGFRHHTSTTLRLADPQEQQRIRSHYDRNQKRFLAQYGCVPYSKTYNALFKG